MRRQCPGHLLCVPGLGARLRVEPLTSLPRPLSLFVSVGVSDSAWMSGVNGIVAAVFDLSLYPALFADYAGTWFEMDWVQVGPCVSSFFLSVTMFFFLQ